MQQQAKNACRVTEAMSIEKLALNIVLSNCGCSRNNGHCFQKKIVNYNFQPAISLVTRCIKEVYCMTASEKFNFVQVIFDILLSNIHFDAFCNDAWCH